jgi:hypothetical protein
MYYNKNVEATGFRGGQLTSAGNIFLFLLNFTVCLSLCWLVLDFFFFLKDAITSLLFTGTLPVFVLGTRQSIWG